MTNNQQPTPEIPIPVALPSDSRGINESAVVSDVREQPAAPNVTSVVTSVPPPRVGTRALAKLQHELTLRDWHILHLVADHRYLSTRQLESFCFADLGTPQSADRTARRVLARLATQGVLRTLDRRIGGIRAGSSGTVYYLAPAGARLLDHETGRRFRSREPSERFLQHCLAVGDVHLDLNAVAARDDITEVEVVTEPACWRSWTGPGGELRSLQPDLYTLITGTDYEDSWFIEVDMGTESIPTILGKCAIYDTYRRTGAEQAAHDVFPRVCWLMKGAKDESRTVSLRQRLAAQQYPHGMFHVTTKDQFSFTLTGDPS